MLHNGFAVSVFTGVMKKHSVIYPPYYLSYMNGVLSDTKKVVSTTNVVGYVLGLLGISMIAVTQVVTVLLPLLFAPLVCATFGFLLYKTQPFNEPTVVRVGPSPQGIQE